MILNESTQKIQNEPDRFTRCKFSPVEREGEGEGERERERGRERERESV